MHYWSCLHYKPTKFVAGVDFCPLVQESAPPPAVLVELPVKVIYLKFVVNEYSVLQC